MIKKKMVRVLTVAGLLACLASGCASGGSSVGKEAAADEMKKGGFTVAASCHDPQIIREGDTYYMFGSHMVCLLYTSLRCRKSFYPIRQMDCLHCRSSIITASATMCAAANMSICSVRC